MITLDEVPISLLDKPVADFLIKVRLILLQVTQNQTIEVTTTPYDITNQGSFFLVDATSGAITVNLPTASANQNNIFTVKKIDSGGNAVTVNTVDGSAVSLSSQYDSVMAISDGTEWFEV